WYPLFGTMTLLSYQIPIVALTSQSPWVRVNYPIFFLLSGLYSASTLLVVYWTRSAGYLRPVNAPILSWEAIVYELARWPWGHAPRCSTSSRESHSHSA